MRARISLSLKVLAVAAVAGLLYVPNLGLSPAYLFHDELRFSLQAQAVAATGRDINGRFMPLYFSEPAFEAGRDPIPIYLAAAVLKVFPVSESAARLPSAMIGVLNVVLMFLLGRALFRSDAMGLVAAGLLALTPTHFIHSRLGLSVVYPLPFVIGWLYLIVRYIEHPRTQTLFAAATVLGWGIYSYLAAMVMMPMYLAATVVLLARRRAVQPILVAVAGFGVPLLLLAAWHYWHPERYQQILGAYRVYDSTLSPLQGVKDLTSYFSLGERSNVYWQAFNPGRLFFTGESSLINSTRLVGSFLLPVAILLPMGIVHLVRRGRTEVGALLLFGLATAPLPGVLVADDEIRRWLVMIPFAVVISTYGVQALWTSGRPLARIALVLLLAFLPLQFRAFYADYMGDYTVRSAGWFGGNIRGAVQHALDSRASTVYLSENIPHIDGYWRFYAQMFHRQDLLGHAVYFTPGQMSPPALSTPAALIIPSGDAGAIAPWISAGWTRTADVSDPDGTVSFLVFTNVPGSPQSQ